jgi:hypothetical protein
MPPYHNDQLEGAEELWRAYQRIMINTTTQKINNEIINTNLKISFCNGVIPFFGSFVSFAIRPKTVLSPVATHTPVQLPDMAWEPWRPILCVSR